MDYFLKNQSVIPERSVGFLILFLSWLVSVVATMQIRIQQVSYSFIRFPFYIAVWSFLFNRIPDPLQKRRFWPAKMPKKFWSFVPGRKGSRYIAGRRHHTRQPLQKLQYLECQRNLMKLIPKRTSPQSLTRNLKISPWKRRFLLETIIFRFHVKTWGCNSFRNFGLFRKEFWSLWAWNVERYYALNEGTKNAKQLDD